MSSHPDNKEIVSLRYDSPQGTVFYVDAEIALGCQTTLQRSMSLACPGLCQRHHCLYKWTSTFEMQRIISTRELSELHTLVPKLPLSPSAPEWHIVGCMAPLDCLALSKTFGRASATWLLSASAPSVVSSGMQNGFAKSPQLPS